MSKQLFESVTRQGVLSAIAQCDELGRDEFLSRYGFGRHRGYALRHEGIEYDSKAILGVAYGHQHPSHGPLKSSEFFGGPRVAVVLENLGFRVDDPKARG